MRSAGHILRLQKLQESGEAQSAHANEAIPNGDGNKKKRKAGDEDGEDTVRKRSRAANGLPEGLFDLRTQEGSKAPIVQPAANEIRIPSRPATPLKPPVGEIPKRPDVDEDEWAAFEADIAAAEAPTADDAVISAPAMSAAELAAKSAEETNAQRRERQEAELEGDKEDAARKLEEEFDEMQGLEERVKRMKEKREALRRKESTVQLANAALLPSEDKEVVEEDDEEEEDDDDWDAFRMRG